MKIAKEWKEYKILDMAEGQKLEKWGEVILSRPDPQIIWKEKSFPKKWKDINAIYHRSKISIPLLYRIIDNQNSDHRLRKGYEYFSQNCELRCSINFCGFIKAIRYTGQKCSGHDNVVRSGSHRKNDGPPCIIQAILVHHNKRRHKTS